MIKVQMSDLFPTKLNAFIFFLYMALFVNQGLLVTASQKSNNNEYSYNTVLVVFLTELSKLFFSIVIYTFRSKTCSFFNQAVIHIKRFYEFLIFVYLFKTVLWLYFVPSFLYCLYNNLSFVNLSIFDPTTYFLLLQLRVVVTGILFQVIFKKHLNVQQWTSLLILTLGCVAKELNWEHWFNFESSRETNSNDINLKQTGLRFNLATFFIFIQILCSCFAGVYNEFLLKTDGDNVDMFVQNAFMYLDSVLCNIFALAWENEAVFTAESFKSLCSYNVLFIVANGTAAGITTSFFLKSLNSIVKTFASALELIFVAILSYLLFNVPIKMNTVVSLALVMFAIFLYSSNPVSAKATEVKKKSEMV